MIKDKKDRKERDRKIRKKDIKIERKVENLKTK